MSATRVTVLNPIGELAAGHLLNMKTLLEIVRSKNIRVGDAHGVSKRGPFWAVKIVLAVTSTESPAGEYEGAPNPNGIVTTVDTNVLELRHYRDDQVRATVVNYLDREPQRYRDVSNILGCASVEEVLPALKERSFRHHGKIMGDRPGEASVVESLLVLGLPMTAVGPDEAPVSGS